LNIAHLHFRFARQASERDSQLGATITSHAAQAGAIDLGMLRHRWPGHARRVDVAKGATAHVLFIRVERFVSNESSRQQSASKPDLYRCQANLSILPGGSSLSSREDRRIFMDHLHSPIARRLKRANGHLESIIEMVEQGRPCAQIAQQLQAVESAIENAKKALIHDHVSHSLERSLKAAGSKGQAALRDFKLIAKYL
jgi:hypothetical protein NreA